jgi:hemerythrin
VEFLEGYLSEHFGHEENCMHRFRCPAHQDNLRTHGEFLTFDRAFVQRLRSKGCGPEVMREIYDYCSDWIGKHIMRIDVQLKPCLIAPADSDGPEDMGPV